MTIEEEREKCFSRAMDSLHKAAHLLDLPLSSDVTVDVVPALRKLVRRYQFCRLANHEQLQALQGADGSEEFDQAIDAFLAAVDAQGGVK